jgi:hypothetical protein
MVTVTEVDVPEASPDQDENLYPVAGVAVTVTCWPWVYVYVPAAGLVDPQAELFTEMVKV